MREVALNRPEVLRQILDALPSDFDKAYRLAEEVGLTEVAVSKAGGGLFWIFSIAGAILLAGGCRHCAPYKRKRKDPDYDD